MPKIDNKFWAAIVGTPTQFIDQMAPFVDLRVDYFMLGSGEFPDLTTLEMLKQEVLPMLKCMGECPLQWFQLL